MNYIKEYQENLLESKLIDKQVQEELEKEQHKAL
jgi:hypothetical protein